MGQFFTYDNILQPLLHFSEELYEPIATQASTATPTTPAPPAEAPTQAAEASPTTEPEPTSTLTLTPFEATPTVESPKPTKESVFLTQPEDESRSNSAMAAAVSHRGQTYDFNYEPMAQKNLRVA